MKFGSTSKSSAPAACQEGDLVDRVTIKWLQYAGLQHLASPLPDQRQLLTDLLLQSYGGHAIPGNEYVEYNSVQGNPQNSFAESSKCGSVWIRNGLLDLKSTHHDTHFLWEDLTTEPLDLFPTSPPKEIKDKVPLEFSSFTSPDRLKDTDNVLALEKKIGICAKDEDMAVAENVDIVALQIASPEWSPTRGLYHESSLIEGTNCTRSTGKYDDDFSFLTYEESSKNSERNRRTLSKMENISKKSPSMDCITLKIKTDLHDLTHISSPRKFESRSKAASVRRKEIDPKEAYSDIRVVGDENKLICARPPVNKEPVATSKSKDHNSKRVSTDQTAINPKDTGITNVEPVKQANEQIHNPGSISREEVPSTKGTDVRSKEKNAAKIGVVVSKRPLNKKERHKKEKDVLSIEDSKRLIIHEPKVKFDTVLHEQATNDESLERELLWTRLFYWEHSNELFLTKLPLRSFNKVYNVKMGPSIPTILEQTKLTCFTFGHTGSGKTFTMGNLSLRASKDILQLLQKTPQAIRNLTLWIKLF